MLCGISLIGRSFPDRERCAHTVRGATMQYAVTRINRNIFTKDTVWNNKDKMDALVFKVCVVLGAIALLLPWGGQA